MQHRREWFLSNKFIYSPMLQFINDDENPFTGIQCREHRSYDTARKSCDDILGEIPERICSEQDASYDSTWKSLNAIHESVSGNFCSEQDTSYDRTWTSINTMASNEAAEPKTTSPAIQNSTKSTAKHRGFHEMMEGERDGKIVLKKCRGGQGELNMYVSKTPLGATSDALELYLRAQDTHLLFAPGTPH